MMELCLNDQAHNQVGEEMKQQLVETFSFDELDDDIKDKVLENLYDINIFDDWWDSVYDDAKIIGTLIGIDIDKIYFSGFSSQGDGACFEGDYQYKKGGLKAVKVYSPKDSELHQIAKDLQDIQRVYFYKLEARVKQRGHYYHELCTQIDVYCGDEANDSAEDSIKEILRDYMRWIYRHLENEWDYLTSEEQIKESIRCNDYYFTADGKIF